MVLNSSSSSSSDGGGKSSMEVALVNRLNKSSTSPLCIAAAALDVRMILLLLKHGADAVVGKWQGKSALAATAKKVGGGRSEGAGLDYGLGVYGSN
jgi:hypothetical protein